MKFIINQATAPLLSAAVVIGMYQLLTWLVPAYGAIWLLLIIPAIVIEFLIWTNMWWDGFVA